MAGRAVGELRMTAAGAAAPAGGSREPQQYIEFMLSIPLKGGS